MTPWIIESKFKEYSYCISGKSVEIGNDVWIGASVLPYGIVGGVPSKLIRYRFSESDIELLMQSKWWEMDIELLHRNVDAF